MVGFLFLAGAWPRRREQKIGEMVGLFFGGAGRRRRLVEQIR